MSCVEAKTLADFGRGRLAAAQASKVKSHLAGCDRCTAANVRLLRVSDTLQAIAEETEPALSAAGQARIEATLRWTRIDPEPTRRFAIGGLFTRPAYLSAAAAMMLVTAAAAFTVWRHRQGEVTSDVALIAVNAVQPVLQPAPPAVKVEPLRAVITLVGGDARVDHGTLGERPADPAQPLREKDRLSTAPGARIAFQWGEGSGALLDGGSEMALDRLEAHAQEFRLLRGQVSVRVGPHQPGESLRVISPDHTVTVHGTWFIVAAEARGGTTVQVLEGVVEVSSRQGDGASTKLMAPSRAYFPREHGVADGERPLTGREAALLRGGGEMGLLAWAGIDIDAVFNGTGLIRIASNPPASLVVDGVAFGQTPLELRRPRARHLVELSRPGFATVRRWITVGDEKEDLHLALPEEARKVESTPAAPEEVREVVSARRRQVSACYERALKRDPSLAGTVTMAIRIGPAGQVLDSRIESNTLEDEQVVGCLVKEAKGWVFQRARNATVVYPFVFRAP